MLRAAAARALERGALRGPVAKRLSRLWERWSDPVRPLDWPDGVRVIGVGGATLGGAGKTPLVLELAARLGELTPVSVVASGYRASIRSARRVLAHDRAEQVGDEALLLARALQAPVVVGPRRRQAVQLAASLAPLVIVDGLLQARPRRIDLSILVVDGQRPWGSAACPPAGDLRAPLPVLLAASDVVLVPEHELSGALTPGGGRVGLGELARLRLGVLLAIARPERVVAGLERAGIRPVEHRLFADHGWPRERRRAAAVDAWLTTAKCKTKLADRFEGAPIWVLEHRIRLPAGLVEAVASGRKPVVESAPCSRTES